jgi:YVTN family beta-propeller protein
VLVSGDGVWRIDLDTMTVAGAKILTGNMGGVGYSYGQSSGIALSPDGSKLAVAGSFDNVVSIIDTASWAFEQNIETGLFPTYVAFSADGTRLFVSCKNDGRVDSISLDGTPPLSANITVGDQPWHLLPDSTGDYLYINAWGADLVQSADLSFNAVAASYFVHSKVTGLHLDEDAGIVSFSLGTSTTNLGGSVGFGRTESGGLAQASAPFLVPTGSIDVGFAPSALASGGGVIALAAPTGDGAVILGGPGGCTAADLAEPFGVLDLGDLAAFVTAFSMGDPAADLAPPTGVLDLADLSAFVVSFTGGCP